MKPIIWLTLFNGTPLYMIRRYELNEGERGERSLQNKWAELVAKGTCYVRILMLDL